ncbi:MAG: hypothetical protein IKL82_01560 [Clostridia bacterium]|nr:hypothetical protein [Clostridia bacterium]
MFDIHSHVLPFVDDGSSSLESSLDLIKTEMANGVTDIMLTPHFKRGIYDYGVDELKEKFLAFKEETRKAGLNVNLYLGQEVYCDRYVYDHIKEGKVLTLNGTRYILIEFDYFTETDILDYVYNIVMLGYKPIIAHIERYSYLDWNTIFDLKQMGALIQVNAFSITGDFGRQFQKKVISAIKKGLIDFVASDVHSGRDCVMQKAYKTLLKHAGRTLTDRVFKHNAEQLFKN